ncbi:hypothetical protein [Nocardia sp. NPDC004722]
MSASSWLRTAALTGALAAVVLAPTASAHARVSANKVCAPGWIPAA